MISLEMNAQNHEFLTIFTPTLLVDNKHENTQATISNIWIYFAINDLEEFIKQKYVIYILPTGNKICFQDSIYVGQFRKNSSLFVD